jgi:hypothetical protein
LADPDLQAMAGFGNDGSLLADCSNVKTAGGFPAFGWLSMWVTTGSNHF